MAQPAIGKLKTDWKHLLKSRKTIHKISKPCRRCGTAHLRTVDLQHNSTFGNIVITGGS